MQIRAVVFSSIFILVLSACSSSKKPGSGEYEEGSIPPPREGYILRDVNFGFDSSELGPDATEILRGHVQWIDDNPETLITLEGHCDERGTAEYNLALGERRSKSVYDFLRSAGVEEERLRSISYGEELPLDPRSNDDAWAKNRRVHFAINEEE